jgi:NAD+ kinase
MPSYLRTVGLLAKKHHQEAVALAETVGNFLQQKGVNIFYLDQDADYDGQRSLEAAVDLVLVFGGDGTMINASRYLAGKNIPVAGINLGRLGFLLELSRADWQDALTKALEHGFEREDRMLVSSEVARAGKILQTSVAANEFVISRGGLVKLIAMELSAFDKKLLYLRADGLIIASPSGSTAYANSAGGPVLHPALNVYSVMAVCPFFTRFQPLVLDAETVFTVKVCEISSSTYLSGDGQRVCKLQHGDIIRIKGIPGGFVAARFGLNDFFDKMQAAGILNDSP